MSYKTAYDAIHMYLSDVTSRVVAKSGRHTDRHHLGKILLHCIRDDPEFIMQIDGAKDVAETNGSVLNRSVRCAIAMTKLGIQKGDVMILTGLNHNDLCIPHHAALYLGVMVAGVDPTLGVNELRDFFRITKPKIIFCEGEKVEIIKKALKNAELDAIIVAFSEGSGQKILADLIEDVDDKEVDKFEPTEFNPEETTAYLVSTSGTTGLPKAAILTHTNLFYGITYIWLTVGSKYPTPTKTALCLSPIQWMTAGFFNIFGPILKITKLQSSEPVTPELFAHLLNTYKPTCTMTGPLLLQSMLPYTDQCQFSCFEYILVGGSAASTELLNKLKQLAKTDHVYRIYGMSEIGGSCFHHDYPPPDGSSGTARGHLEYRLVDPDNQEDITEAKVPGELWIRGPSVFKGYYNNPEMTAEALTSDGWFKTGDLLYRDNYYHFYFVDRLKSLLKYRGHQVSPVEVETVIKSHPGVLEVCVTGIPDEECGELVVACVVPRPGCSPSAQEIKDLVKESLSDSKQLRGGVIFFEELPTTGTSKIHRKKIKEMVLTMDRE